MPQVQIPNLDHCIWRARINHLCKSGLDPIDCKSSFSFFFWGFRYVFLITWMEWEIGEASPEVWILDWYQSVPWCSSHLLSPSRNFSSWQQVKMLSRVPNHHFWVEWLLVLKNASGCNVFRNFALTRYVSWQSQSACLDDTKQPITTLKKHNNLSTD